MVLHLDGRGMRKGSRFDRMECDRDERRTRTKKSNHTIEREKAEMKIQSIAGRRVRVW